MDNPTPRTLIKGLTRAADTPASGTRPATSRGRSKTPQAQSQSNQSAASGSIRRPLQGPTPGSARKKQRVDDTPRTLIRNLAAEASSAESLAESRRRSMRGQVVDELNTPRTIFRNVVDNLSTQESLNRTRGLVNVVTPSPGGSYRGGGFDSPAEQYINSQRKNDADRQSLLGDLQHEEQLAAQDEEDEAADSENDAEDSEEGDGSSTAEPLLRTGHVLTAPSAPVLDKDGFRIPRSVSSVRKPAAVPASLCQSIFQKFTPLQVSAGAKQELIKISDIFIKQMVGDLSGYAAHARRGAVDCSDVELLMRRQQVVHGSQTLDFLIHKHLPMDAVEQLVPIARAGNVVFPGLAGRSRQQKPRPRQAAAEPADG